MAALARRSPLLLLLLRAERAAGGYDPINKVESAQIFGNIDEVGYYYVDILVGTPPQRVSVILDTGSGVCAFPCASCEHCGRHLDPAFDYARSTTASWLPCGDSCFGNCHKDQCSYFQGYTEGSYISGFWFRDEVRLGDPLARNPAVTATVGCHRTENNLFYTQKANGILGIAPGATQGHTLLQELFQDTPHVQGGVFAICFAEWGGRLVVGGYNASYHTGPLRTIPLVASVGSYSVPLTAMHVDGHLVSTAWGSAMIDSGTTFTYMGSAPYFALKGAIETYCREHDSCGAEAHGPVCWRLRGPEGLLDFPTVDVSFQDVQTQWVPRAYLYRKGTSRIWCYGFEDDGPGANTVLGASWMMYQEVVIDIHNRQVGLAPAECPDHRQRPAAPPRGQPPPSLPPGTKHPTIGASLLPESLASSSASAGSAGHAPGHRWRSLLLSSSRAPLMATLLGAAALTLAALWGCRLCAHGSSTKQRLTQLKQQDEGCGVPLQTVEDG